MLSCYPFTIQYSLASSFIFRMQSEIVHAGVKPPVNDIEQICRCPGEKSNAPNLCHKLPRFLNYAIYDKMTCILHRHLLAVTIP